MPKALYFFETLHANQKSAEKIRLPSKVNVSGSTGGFVSGVDFVSVVFASVFGFCESTSIGSGCFISILFSFMMDNI